MLTVLDLHESGVPVRVDPPKLDAPPAGVLRWIDVQTPTKEVLEQLRVPYGLHPLAIEDCLTFEQRPKLEEYPGHLFVVIHELSGTDSELIAQELHAFIGINFLITVHAETCDRIGTVRERIRNDSKLYARGLGFVYYLIADAIASRNSDVVEGFADQVEVIEDLVLNGDTSESQALGRLFGLKRSLGAARRAISPQRDLFATLARLERSVVNERLALYFRDVYDKIVRSVESIEVGRELLSNILDAHFSLVSQRTNDIVKRLTVLSAIFLPLTFITGFFGQNFQGLPFDSNRLLWLALGAYVLLPPVMLFWFHRKRWT